MKRTFTFIAAIVLLFLFALPALAQRSRDPLTEVEADQLREMRQEPMKRLRLMVKFARARLTTAEQLRANPTLPDANKQIRTALEDFTNIVDEMDSNVDAFKSDDIRKPLKEIVEADTDFQLKLRTLKEGTPEKQRIDYTFALDSAIDSVNASADTARAMLEDQLAKRGKVKESDKKDKDKDDKDDDAADKKRKDRNDSTDCPVKPC
jgi:hypothetical protein